MSAFADVSRGLLSPRDLWRPIRPLLILSAGLVLALVTDGLGLNNTLTITTVISCVLLLAMSALLGRGMTAHPSRGALRFELELSGLLLLATMMIAAVVLGLSALTRLASASSLTFMVGVFSGAIVGYFSKDVLRSSEEESWLAVHYRYRMNGALSDFFFRQDARGNWVADERARWDPAGVQSDALAADQFVDGVTFVNGWGWDARRKRCAVLQRGMEQAAWTPPALADGARGAGAGDEA